MQAKAQILPLYELSTLRTPFLLPPQELAATHVEAVGEFYKNKEVLEHYKHFEESLPTEH